MRQFNFLNAGRLQFFAACLKVMALLARCTSCEDFVQVDLPPSQLAAAQVFRDKATATAALTNIYAEMRDFGMLNGGRNGITYQLGH